MMTKKLLKELKEKLEKEKKSLEEELKSFAKEDVRPKGDWDTRYPKFDGGKLEEEADELQEYDKLISVEHNLELRLKDVDLAIEKMKRPTVHTQEKYGKCEKCGKKIDIKRLEACPEARLCLKCK